jgi:hypothetical protein
MGVAEKNSCSPFFSIHLSLDLSRPVVYPSRLVVYPSRLSSWLFPLLIIRNRLAIVGDRPVRSISSGKRGVAEQRSCSPSLELAQLSLHLARLVVSPTWLVPSFIVTDRNSNLAIACMNSPITVTRDYVIFNKIIYLNLTVSRTRVSQTVQLNTIYHTSHLFACWT